MYVKYVAKRGKQHEYAELNCELLIVSLILKRILARLCALMEWFLVGEAMDGSWGSLEWIQAAISC